MNNIERKRLGLPYRYDDPALLGDRDTEFYYKDRKLDVWE